MAFAVVIQLHGAAGHFVDFEGGKPVVEEILQDQVLWHDGRILLQVGRQRQGDPPGGFLPSVGVGITFEEKARKRRTDVVK